MPRIPSPLRLYPTEAAARKAGLQLASLTGGRVYTVLYALRPADAKMPIYLLSSSSRLTVSEQRWVEAHQATVSKLGRFHPGGGFMPLQTHMRRVKPAGQAHQAE